VLYCCTLGFAPVLVVALAVVLLSVIPEGNLLLSLQLQLQLQLQLLLLLQLQLLFVNHSKNLSS